MSLPDRFFRPNPEPPPEGSEGWDGIPKVLVTAEQLESLYRHIPCWHALVAGPAVPFSGGIRAMVDSRYIFQPTREDAQRQVEANVRNSCKTEGMPYDSDQWVYGYIRASKTCN